MNDNAPTTFTKEERDRALFDRIAEGYGRKDLLPASRRARIQRLMRTLRAIPNHQLGDVLEAGCGAGFSALYLQGRSRSFTGIDYSSNLVELASANVPESLGHFEVANIKEYAPGRRFDAIFMIGVLHHIDDPLPALQNLTHLLNPGGWLVVNEPQPGNPLVSRMRRLRKRLDRDYSDEQLEMSFELMKGLFIQAGLTDIQQRGQGVVSTPFAEVIIPPQFLTYPLCCLCCWMDNLLENLPLTITRRLCWNAVVAGRRPESP